MSIHDEIAADATEIFAVFGNEILLGGQTLPALISEPQETGGFTASGNFTVKVLRAQVPTLPRIGEMLSYAGETYRIVRVANRPPHAIIALTVEPLE